ncbi:hypothetical protein EJ08DRAFT_652130 [Tothia fuscella]|uniref:Uncharacterized protein n=1 Tax=Tothia fuscella TaxID=1048955 RepID=A0A9P4NK70_9PEZI|nr:hypothetical protein EJ08DRAFT_652130 [Tothia fuscella]
MNRRKRGRRSLEGYVTFGSYSISAFLYLLLSLTSTSLLSSMPPIAHHVKYETIKCPPDDAPR